MDEVRWVDDLLITDECVVYNGKDIDDLDELPLWAHKYIEHLLNED